MPNRNIRKGQSLIELLAGMLVVIPIILSVVDLATIFLGAQMNNNVCRDAARAAASGPPDRITANQPKERAEAVVKRSLQNTGAVRMDPTVVVTENVNTVPSPPFGGAVDGSVTVQTTVNIYPPFFVGHIVMTSPIKIRTSQTFPYTWVMPGTFNANAGP